MPDALFGPYICMCFFLILHVFYVWTSGFCYIYRSSLYFEGPRRDRVTRVTCSNDNNGHLAHRYVIFLLQTCFMDTNKLISPPPPSLDHQPPPTSHRDSLVGFHNLTTSRPPTTTSDTSIPPPQTTNESWWLVGGSFRPFATFATFRPPTTTSDASIRVTMTKMGPNDARCVVCPIGMSFFFFNCALLILTTFFTLFMLYLPHNSKGMVGLCCNDQNGPKRRQMCRLAHRYVFLFLQLCFMHANELFYFILVLSTS